jgi:serine/threonine protein kinase
MQFGAPPPPKRAASPRRVGKKDPNNPLAGYGGCNELQRYGTIRQLGKGSYGTVNLVRNKKDSQLYVMKVVKNTTFGSRKHSIEAVQEVKILESVQVCACLVKWE